MTNKPQTIDEILLELQMTSVYSDPVDELYQNKRKKAKQAIISAIERAKPKEYEDYYAPDPVNIGKKMGYNEAIRGYEANLKKELGL